MTVTVKLDDQVRFVAEARGHRVVCDQPLANKGTDLGMSPPEFLLTSLGTCAAYYAVEYLKARNLSADGLHVDVEAVKAPSPARLAEFRIVIHTPELEERHQQGVLRAAKSCLIHNTLLHAPAIGIAIDTPVTATQG